METCTKFLRRSAMLFTLIFLFALQGQSQTTVLTESFDAGVLPAGWSQSYVVGTTNWVFNAVGGSSAFPLQHIQVRITPGYISGVTVPRPT